MGKQGLSLRYHIGFTWILSFFVTLFLLIGIGPGASPGLAAQVKLAWNANTDSSVAGYKLYYGTASRTYNAPVDVGSKIEYTLTNIVEGKAAYFAVTAYDSNRTESDFSQELACVTLVPSAGANGTISPSSTVVVSSDMTQTFTITPAANYKVSDVTVDGASVGAVTSYTFSNATASHTISASFVSNTSNAYTITASAGANGSISPSGPVSVNSGGSQSFTITPAASYTVSDVTVDGASVGAVTSYTFSNVTASHTISASFGGTAAPLKLDFEEGSGITATDSSGSDNDGTISNAVYTTDRATGSYALSFAGNGRVGVPANPSLTPSNISVGFWVKHTTDTSSSYGGMIQGAYGNGYSRGFRVLDYKNKPGLQINFGDAEPITVSGKTFVQNQWTHVVFSYDHQKIKLYQDGVLAGEVSETRNINWNTTSSDFTIGLAQWYFRGLIDNVQLFDHALSSQEIGQLYAERNNPAPTVFVISASAGANGAISPSGPVSVNSGGSQSFTITPAANYKVSDVMVDGASVGAVTSYTFSNVTANHTISASFVSNAYTITASAGANGAISPSGPVSVNSGGSQSFTITPSASYKVSDVMVDGASVGAVTSYAFSNVTANHTISASFVSNGYTITASAGANGAISPSGPVSVNSGGSQSFTITPSASYKVSDVMVDGASVGAVTSYAFSNVTANHTISASFVSNGYTITASAGANGSISPSGTVSVNSGGSQSFTITPSASYKVSDVTVDGASVGAVTRYAFSNVTANHTISASFVSNGYTITASAGANGAISPSGTVSVNSGGSQSFTITPAASYTVSDVTVDGASVGPVTSYTFSNVTANHTISASFGGTAAPLMELNFDEGSGSTATDSSGSGNDGSISNAVYTADNATGSYALSFAGNGRVSVPANPSLKPSDITVGFWVKHTTDTSSSYGGMIQGAYGNGYSRGFRVLDYKNKPGLQINFGDAEPITVSGKTFVQNQWTHVVFSYDHQKIKLYQDGVLAGEISETRNINWNTAASDFTIGLAQWYFRGSIDNVQLFDHALSSQEIGQLYAERNNPAPAVFVISASAGENGSISPSGSISVNAGDNQSFTITPSANFKVSDVTVDGASVGAVTSYTFSNVTANHTISASFNAPAKLELNFEEGSGSTAIDGSGSGNNGTISNAVYTTDGATGSYALSFTGNGRVSVPANPSLKPSDITVGFWVKHTTDTSSSYGGMIQGAYGNGYSRGFRVLDYKNKPGLQINFGDAEPITVSGKTFVQNQWTHVAFSYDHQKIKLYQDGVLAGEVSETRNINWNTAASDFTIGLAQWYFRGLIDRVQLFDRALSSQEIGQLNVETGFASFSSANSSPMLSDQTGDKQISSARTTSSPMASVKKGSKTHQTRKEKTTRVESQLLAGSGMTPGSGGWIKILTAGGEEAAPSVYMDLPEYNALSGEIRIATGDVDGDGRDNIVVGLGRIPDASGIPGGYFAVLDDNYAIMACGQIEWPEYNTTNGETRPACGDIDGDGIAEIIIGLGPGGEGRMEIFKFENQQLKHVKWLQTGWEDYNRGNGEIRPACGDLDGDGKDEVIAGLGPVMDNPDIPGGIFFIFDQTSVGSVDIPDPRQNDASGRGVVSWPEYNRFNGEIWPACGDVNADGKDEILLGLGKEGEGRFEILGFDLLQNSIRPITWQQSLLSEGAAIHPACGNFEKNAGDEIVITYSRDGIGYMEIFGNAAEDFQSIRQVQTHVESSAKQESEVWPAVFRLRDR